MVALSVPESVRPLRDKVLRFIEDEIYPHEQALLEKEPGWEQIQAELIGKAKANDLWAMGHPKSMGGQGLPWVDYAYINEVIGRTDAAMNIFGSYSVQTCLMIEAGATPEMRETVLLPAVRGDVTCAFAVTEPGAASSDPTNITTTAHLDGDEWVINGTKWYTSHADHAEWIAVMCRTEGDDTPLHRRFSMFLVPTSNPGFKIARDVMVMGLASNHPECTYDDVRIPASHLLGTRGQGFDLFQTRLGPARLTNCMRWLGQAQRAFDLMCSRLNTRQVRDGSVLGDKQLMQELVYQSYVDIQTSRALVFEASSSLDRGSQGRVEISAAKTEAARMLTRVIDRAIQVHGALGVCDLTPLERMYRMARIYRIVDGPDEVHIERVGRLILREYREGRGWEFGMR